MLYLHLMMLLLMLMLMLTLLLQMVMHGARQLEHLLQHRLLCCCRCYLYCDCLLLLREALQPVQCVVTHDAVLAEELYCSRTHSQKHP